MGMYTELRFTVELKRDTPGTVIQVLQEMLGEREDGTAELVELPRHPLFDCYRWHIMLTCDSYYFKADTHSTLRWDRIASVWFLSVQTNLKNYDDEIRHFLDWIEPYVEADEGEFLGYTRYEEDDVPTLIFKGRSPLVVPTLAQSSWYECPTCGAEIDLREARAL